MGDEERKRNREVSLLNLEAIFCEIPSRLIVWKFLGDKTSGIFLFRSRTLSRPELEILELKQWVSLDSGF